MCTVEAEPPRTRRGLRRYGSAPERCARSRSNPRQTTPAGAAAVPPESPRRPPLARRRRRSRARKGCSSERSPAPTRDDRLARHACEFAGVEDERTSWPCLERPHVTEVERVVAGLILG